MLVNATEMLQKARDGHYAVGQFNINNLEWTKAALQAAQEMNSPIILGVSEGAGKYMTGFKTVAAMVKAMIDTLGITVPVALHLDHGSYEGAKACVEAGFSSIMFDGSHYAIDENVAKTTELVALADVDTTSQAYASAQTYIESIQAQYQELASEVVATTDVDLTVNDPDTGERAVRSAETNLGDLCADAYRIVLGADIGWVNGGGVRADIAAGDITYGDIIEVHPFGNLACLVEVSGQQILDALELGSMYVGTAESGGFLQVSGLKYTVNTAIPTSVVLDDEGNFVEVSGARRVSDVQVLDSETGEYTAIDPTATYTLASHNYMLKDGGDGYTMFGEDNVTILQDEVMVDNEVLITYIRDELGGVVGQEYADPHGQGRITIVNETVEEPSEPEQPADTTTYVVVAGDSLWKIAQQYYGTGTRWDEIYQDNRDTIQDPNAIWVGQVLVIPAQ